MNCTILSAHLSVSSQLSFPEWSTMFLPLMKVLAVSAFRSLACNMRGAALAWTLARTLKGRTRMKSISALSVPHVDAFSDGLYNPHADREQQYSSQYITVFTLPNSASLHWNFLYNTMANARAVDGCYVTALNRNGQPLSWI